RGWDGSEHHAAHHLLVPLIRIALSDPAFFSDAQHPARAVLASLGTSRDGLEGRLANARATLDGMAAGVQAPSQLTPLSGAELLQRLFGECRWLPEMTDEALVETIIGDLEKDLREMAVPNPLISKARTALVGGLGSQEMTRRLLDLDTLAERAPVAAPEAAK